MPEVDAVLGQVGDVFGFGGWELGLGQVGNFIMWFCLAMFFVGILAGVIIFFMIKKTYKHKIIVLGLIGGSPKVKWKDKAKEVAIGKAGDKLFYVKKKKRFIPPPEIQSAPNEWLFWEREDGELINVGYENVDEKQRQMGIKFIHTDMRMQRLGIEKNLQFRLQKQNFWEKYGQTVMNIIFYIFIFLILIVLFVQWRKTGETLNSAMEKADNVMEKILRYEGISPYVPEAKQTEGGGLIPALVLLILARRGGRRRWDLAMP